MQAALRLPEGSPLRPRPVSAATVRLSTEDVARRERRAYWLDMICAAYARLECEPAGDSVFGEIEFSALSSLELTRVCSDVRAVRRTERMIRADARDACLVMIQRQGRSIVRQDGREACLAPGDYVLYDTSRPYELRFEHPRHEVIVIGLPRSELGPQVGNLQELTATTVPGGCAAGHLLLNMVDTLRQQVQRLHPASIDGVAQGITHIVAAGLRGLPAADAGRSSRAGALHVARVKRHVLDHLRDPDLSVARIAAALRLSPNYLNRLFRAEPMPLSRLIWQLRLQACRRDLCDPGQRGRSASEIAFGWGFNDAAHFSRAFRERFGVSPRDCRLQALAGVGAEPPRGSRSPGRQPPLSGAPPGR